jgi:glycogen operon protein
MPKAVITDPDFDWEAERAIRNRWQDTLVYEAHVRGLTMRHPEVPKADRGTFQGLASKPVIDHLKSLGVSAIELLPVQAFANDRFLQEKGLSNYWGYNTLSFFAPHARYLKTGAIREVKEAIRRFHAAGLEVILDVVYNHTCEGNEKGTTLSFRGIDNASYYLLSPENRRHGYDTTGTGNTLNVAHPMVLRMVLDSLRYYVQTMHVDGLPLRPRLHARARATGFEREGASSRRCARTRSCPPSSSSPSPGTWARAATRWAASPGPSASGTTSSATTPAASGARTRGSCPP